MNKEKNVFWLSGINLNHLLENGLFTRFPNPKSWLRFGFPNSNVFMNKEIMNWKLANLDQKRLFQMQM